MELICDGKPVYLASESGKTFRLIEDWKFQHDCFTPFLVVPKGYKSDLASIPSWIFWWQWGKWNTAAILHDYIYEHGYIWTEWARIEEKFLEKVTMDLSRREADMLFYEICLYLGVRPVTAKLMYWAVRLFGRGCWGKTNGTN